jgi:hypothetical protein
MIDIGAWVNVALSSAVNASTITIPCLVMVQSALGWKLFIQVPDVVGNLPAVTSLVPNGDVFPSKILRIVTCGFP